MENKIKEKSKEVIVAHPAQQHSFKLAKAINKECMLQAYCTTVYYKENRILYKILKFILNENNVKRMKGRNETEFNDKIKQFNELFGLFILLLRRLDKKLKVLPKFNKKLNDRFGENVANYAIKNSLDAVIMYDTTANKCFNILKKNKKNIIKILDMSSIPGDYILKIVNKDNRLNGNFSKTNIRKLNGYNSYVIEEGKREIEVSDYFLVPSKFVKDILLSYKIDKEKIFINPYGVDIEKFKYKEYHNNNNKLRFLFVGRLESAKRIYYLLESFKQLNRKDIELYVVGNMLGYEELYEPYKEYFNYLGVKLHNEMIDIYNMVDIYILPSLWEGFSLTLLEAMASGLPVITTYNSGAEGVIENGKEGFIIDAMNIEQLKDKIIWFTENKNKIKNMGKNAREKAQNYTWKDYEKRTINIINTILKNIQKEI